jgi:hypothetical protein
MAKLTIGDYNCGQTIHLPSPFILPCGRSRPLITITVEIEGSGTRCPGRHIIPI